MLLEHLMLSLLKRNIGIISTQFGFRPNINCQTHVSTVQEMILSNASISSIYLCKLHYLRELRVIFLVNNFLGFILGNDFDNVHFDGVMDDQSNLDNSPWEEGFFLQIVFNFYLIDELKRILELNTSSKSDTMSHRFFSHAANTDNLPDFISSKTN